MGIKLTSEEKLRLQQVKNKIDSEYTSADFTIHELCKQFKFSDNKLRYGFWQLCGMSVSEYQTKKRLEHIVRLLENEDTTISQAVFDAGFKEYSTFYRAFKREFKDTPHRWRKSNLNVAAILISSCVLLPYVAQLL